MIALIAAVITCAGTVIAALITTRQRGPAGTVPVPVPNGPPIPVAQPGRGRISKSLWCGIAGLVLWVLPVLAYVVVLPGLYIGLREMRGPRKHTAAGLVLCITGLGLALINSAIGAYMGAHGQL